MTKVDIIENVFDSKFWKTWRCYSHSYFSAKIKELIHSH